MTPESSALASSFVQIKQEDIPAKIEILPEITSNPTTIIRVEVPEKVYKLMSFIESQGYHVRMYGGCVVDHLLNREPSDYDLRTDAPLAICQSLGLYQCKYKPNLFQFSGEQKIDLFSTNPDITSGSNLRYFDDALSLFSADTFGSVRDDSELGFLSIQKKEIILLVPPEQLFADDPITLLRVARKSAKYGFSIPPAVKNTMRDMASFLMKCPRKQVLSMCQKCLSGGQAALHLEQWIELGLLIYIFPSRCERSILANSIDYIWLLNKARQVDSKAENRCSPLLFIILLISSYETASFINKASNYFFEGLGSILSYFGFKIRVEKWMENIIYELVHERNIFINENQYDSILHQESKIIAHHFEEITPLSGAVVSNHFDRNRFFAKLSANAIQDNQTSASASLSCTINQDISNENTALLSSPEKMGAI